MSTIELSPGTARYAVYFAPGEADPWWGAGSCWLGRCARTGRTLPQPRVDGIQPEQLARLTEAPRRYGWHATLKAPFMLAAGCSLPDLQHELDAVASQHHALDLPPLTVNCMGDFLALGIDGDDHAVQHIGAHCVTALHALAAPLPPSEVVRRRGKGLTERQEAMLQAWGYPHVLDQFRFHMSLTVSLQAVEPGQVNALLTGAVVQFSGLPPARFDALDLFVETAPGADFRWLSRHPLVS